jgi:S1-C subfamily serine protease
MEQLIKFGEVKRGRLGIAMTNATGVEGAQIAEVESNSPAAAAGLRKGDVVVALNGHPVRGSAELRARLGVVPAGDTVELKVQRGKETEVLKARIAEVDRSQAAGGQSLPELNGAALAEVERSGLPGKNRAVLVNSVETGSPAYQHGLRQGDLIIGVNQRRVTSVPELSKALRASGRLALNVVRGDFLLTMQLR